MHYEPEPTLPTTDDPTSASLELSMPLSSSTTVEDDSVSIEEDGTSVEDQPWFLEQGAELSRCREFSRITCGCTKAKGKPCSTLFNEEHYTDLRAQASFLTREQLDLVILVSTMATVNTDEFRPSYTRHKPAKRQRMVTTYMHHGHHLCKATCNFLHGVGNHRVKAIKQSYLSNGLSVCTHVNYKRMPHNALTYRQLSNLIKFIQNYAEQHAILLPGRMLKFKRDNMKLLPSYVSKNVAYNKMNFTKLQ